MKKIAFVILLVTASGAAMAQSNSYKILKNKFRDQPDVHSFSVSGWVGRTLLKMAGEFEFRRAIREVEHIRFISIPKTAFSREQVTVDGFKKVLKKDTFEELALIREDREEVSMYIRESNHHKNQYFLLIEEDDEVVAMEIKGYIDPTLLNPKTTTLASIK